MNYEKIGFVSGQTLKAAYMNHIESGIEETLVAAKAYSDSKGGYVEPGKVYTFDGDTTGKDVHTDTGIQYVKIADEYIDPDFIARIVVSLNGNMVEFGRNDIRIGWNGAHYGYSVFIPFDGQEVQIAFGYTDAIGEELWLFADPNYHAFVARLEYAETIHPIDQKYMPDTMATKEYVEQLIIGAMEASY